VGVPPEKPLERCGYSKGGPSPPGPKSGLEGCEASRCRQLKGYTHVLKRGPMGVISPADQL
jgi:hypothetical protein